MPAQQGIKAQLAGEDHRDRCRRFADAIAQPAVQLETRDLDGEGQQKSQRGQPKTGRVRACTPAMKLLLQLHQVEGPCLPIQPQHSTSSSAEGMNA